MKNVVIILLSAFSITVAHAGELKSFNEIYKSIQSGKNIKMVISFDYCNPPPPIKNIIVYTTPKAIMLRSNYMQFANSPLTTNNPKFPNSSILENVTYKITDNNNLNIVTRVITLPDYAVVGETSSVCQLVTAVKVFN